MLVEIQRITCKNRRIRRRPTGAQQSTTPGRNDRHILPSHESVPPNNDTWYCQNTVARRSVAQDSFLSQVVRWYFFMHHIISKINKVYLSIKRDVFYSRLHGRTNGTAMINRLNYIFTDEIRFLNIWHRKPVIPLLLSLVHRWLHQIQGSTEINVSFKALKHNCVWSRPNKFYWTQIWGTQILQRKKMVLAVKWR